MTIKKVTFFVTIAITVLACKNNTSKNTNPSYENATDTYEVQYYDGEYKIIDNQFGTNTTMTIENGNRIMKTNGLPNHKTGEFPNSGNRNSISAQNLSYSFPLKPKLSGESKWAREPGIALNGVKFEPETAERFVCETGEVYRIEAFQELVNLGLDYNNAHVQPTGAYHYHGAPKGLVEVLDKGEDIVLMGYAKDDFPIYYSKSGKYKPSFKLSSESRTGDACSYTAGKKTIKKELNNSSADGIFVSDWTFDQTIGQLDECNGISIDGEYCYFVTNEYPYVGRCLKGVFTEAKPSGGRPGGNSQDGRPNRPPPGGNGGNRKPKGPSPEAHTHGDGYHTH